MKVKEAKSISVTLNGKKFQIHMVPADALPPGKLGGCTSRRVRMGRIFIREDAATEQIFEVLIHEMLHGWFDDKLPEKDTTRLGKDLARALRRIGFVHLSEVASAQ